MPAKKTGSRLGAKPEGWKAVRALKKILGLDEKSQDEPEPSPLGKVVGSWVGLAGDVIPWGRRIATAASSPIDAVRDVAAIGTGLGSFLAHLVPALGPDFELADFERSSFIYGKERLLVDAPGEVARVKKRLE